MITNSISIRFQNSYVCFERKSKHLSGKDETLKQLPILHKKGLSLNQVASLCSWLHGGAYKIFMFYINNYISSKATYG